MSASVKIIKWMTLITIIFFVVTCFVNTNAETGMIVLDTALISNSMIMTLCGGICTGLVAVLAEKNYKYYLDKNTFKSYLYNMAKMLYSDFYYVHRNINELLYDKNTQISKNLFTSRLPTMQNRLMGIANTDYCVFRKKNKFMLVHNNFVNEKVMLLKNKMDQYIYFEIAFTEAEINRSKKVENADENIYQVLKILNSFTKEAMEILDQYLCALQEDSPKNLTGSIIKK